MVVGLLDVAKISGQSYKVKVTDLSQCMTVQYVTRVKVDYLVK